MNGNQIKSNSGRKMNVGGAFATIALLSVSMMAAGANPAAAQGVSTGTVAPQRSGQSMGNSSMRIPSSMTPIVSRIAEMWVAANHRATDKSVSEGARESYRSASSALRQAITSAHLRPSGGGEGRYDADLIISSGQLLSDIAALRSAAANMSGPRAADLNQVASLYATGAKEYFTGTIRDALLSSGGSHGTSLATNTATSGTIRVSNQSIPYVDPVAESGGMPSSLPNIGVYGFAPDPTFWGPPIVNGANDGGAVVVGPQGVSAIPGTGVVNPGPTVVVGPPAVP